MSDVIERFGRLVRNRWKNLIQRLTGRYYDPSMDSVAAALTFFGIVIADSARRGMDGESVDPVVAAAVVIVLAVGLGWMYYRSEQRWRA